MTGPGGVEAVAIGLASGLLSGAFGVGGGVVTTPLIRMVLGVGPLIALGTPLPVTLPAAITGVWAYARQGQVDLRVVAWCAPVGAVAAVVGSAATHWIDGHLLMLVTALLILVVGLDFATGARARRHRQEAAPRASIPRMVAIGAAGGFLSGLLGLGGGVFLVPAFLLGLGMGVKRAFGTSLAVVCALAVPGTIVHLALGHVDVGLAGLLILGAVPGARLGSRWALRAREANLEQGFGLFLALVALIFGITEFRGGH